MAGLKCRAKRGEERRAEREILERILVRNNR